MSTRSLICIKKEDSYEVIYCHWDGYPHYNGTILKKYYKDPNKVQELIDLGDISSLRREIGQKQNFDYPKEDWTVAYGRDRGEPDINATIVNSFDELKKIADSCGAEYVYVFENNEWKYYGYNWREFKLS